jgi:hypothetical protein
MALDVANFQADTTVETVYHESKKERKKERKKGDVRQCGEGVIQQSTNRIFKRLDNQR